MAAKDGDLFPAFCDLSNVDGFTVVRKILLPGIQPSQCIAAVPGGILAWIGKVNKSFVTQGKARCPLIEPKAGRTTDFF
jgi:hypothetical protein